ncbi:MAG: DUF5011 domain-containing protein, partial [Erysipelotrichaceae bacterium]|nr:DUF5011 domain-containing protein [Erysipelotrichaceae bacterium]
VRYIPDIYLTILIIRGGIYGLFKEIEKNINIFLDFFVLIACYAFYMWKVPVKDEVTVEAGISELDINDFIKEDYKDDVEASFQSTLSEEELQTIGSYHVTLICNEKEYSVKVNVVDTTAPTAVVKDVEVYENDEVTADMFVEEYQDVTEVEVSFKDEVSTTSGGGQQQVTLVFTDTSGKASEYTVSLNVIADTEAPVFSDMQDIEITEGGTVSYKKDVTVTDNHDEDVEINVDTSNVDLNTAGTYEVTYTATDSAGNTATQTRNIIVYAKNEDGITVEEVYELAQEVIDSIITDDMTGYEKLSAIYYWVRNNLTYVSSTDKPAYYISTYQGLTTKMGDCYVYYATSRALLTCAGIDNLEICKSDTSVVGHYWNLVNIGDGWYHFDTVRRKNFSGLYLDDATLMAYSQAHNNSHIYDASLYPDIE